ncbi:MAG: hypothetical protein FJ134_01730 [Deltaproteobacteria bacterium]|nr:hypothetical protein [Deltaproteobacteria bacterium]
MRCPSAVWWSPRKWPPSSANYTATRPLPEKPSSFTGDCVWVPGDKELLLSGQNCHAGAAGIENFTFHDLRHTFTTNMRKAGFHDSVTLAMTGHKATVILSPVINHVSQEEKRAAVRGGQV